MVRLLYFLLRLLAKDVYSFTHSVRVAFRMLKYSRAIKNSNISVAKSFFYGLFHDIGKISIPNSILKKKGRLTDEEFEIIKTHTSNEYAMYVEKFFPGINDHHETMDGKGYFGKTESDLNDYAKLLSIADVYDALSSKRAYKDAMPRHQVLDIMESMASGGKFDELVYRKVVQVA